MTIGPVAAPSAAAERRLHLRLQDYWATLIPAGRALPSRAAIRAVEMPGLREYGLTIDLGPGGRTPTVRFLGDELSKAVGDLTGKPLSDIPGGSVLGAAISRHVQALTGGQPLITEDRLANAIGETYLFRAVLLPFGEDGRTVDFLAGVITFRRDGF